jgi:hypothetical protein
MHLERRRCPLGPYVWSSPEVPLHCRALIDLVMNSRMAHNLQRAWYASGWSCNQEILTCTHLLVEPLHV